MINMQRHAETLRRIAILIDGLDRSTADQLLDQLSEDQQLQIRNAVIDLQNVTEFEQQLVSHEFCEQLQSSCAAPPPAGCCPHI